MTIERVGRRAAVICRIDIVTVNAPIKSGAYTHNNTYDVVRDPPPTTRLFRKYNYTYSTFVLYYDTFIEVSYESNFFCITFVRKYSMIDTIMVHTTQLHTTESTRVRVHVVYLRR